MSSGVPEFGDLMEERIGVGLTEKERSRLAAGIRRSGVTGWDLDRGSRAGPAEVQSA